MKESETMDAYKTVKAQRAPSGRMAILARKDENSPWVQIESMYDPNGELIESFLEQVENDDSERSRYIEENGAEEWGEDAP